MRVGVSLFVSVRVGFAGPSSSGLPRPTLCGSYWLLFSGVWSPGGQIQDPRGPWGQYCLSGGQCRVLKTLGLLPAHWWVMPVPGVSTRLLAGRSVPGVWRQGPGISELVSDYLCVCGGFFTQLGVGSGQNAWWAAVHGAAKSQTRLHFHFHFSLSCIGEGNVNPLQCSCLENPRDRGAWWASVYGVTQSRTRLTRLSSSSSSSRGGSPGLAGSSGSGTYRITAFSLESTLSRGSFFMTLVVEDLSRLFP